MWRAPKACPEGTEMKRDTHRFRRYISMLLVTTVFAGIAISGPIAYLATARQGQDVSTSLSNPFGVLDLGTGMFSSRGNTPVLVGMGTAGGILYGVDVFDQLVTINPTNAGISVVGSLGISSVPPKAGYASFDVFASASGGLYGLDWQNNLYSVNPSTGAATLVGSTGIPVIVSGGIFGTGLSGDANALYLNIGEIRDPVTFADVIPSSIYRIDPATGTATLVGGIPKLPFLGAGFVDGSIYIGKGDGGGLVPPSEIWRFDPVTARVLGTVTLDPALSGFDVFAMVEAPVPEPNYSAMLGLLALAFVMRQFLRRSIHRT